MLIQNPGRETRQIGCKPAANLHHATRFAARSGKPLTEFVTISFARAFCPAGSVSLRFRRLLAQRFAPWLRKAGGGRVPPTYVWVIEAPRGRGHVHWALHLPPALLDAFRRRLPGWVAEAAGVDPATLDPRAIDHRHVENIVGLKRYLLKGMDPYFAERWQIRAAPQGRVIGRRVGVSRNLAVQARRRGGYQVEHWPERG